MPCAVSARAGNEHLMPYAELLTSCAVLARAGENFEPLELLMPCAVLAHAGEEQGRGFMPFESCYGFMLFNS
ncbi:hypothetical protein DVH24_029893 [Malus domestica]|uniref:Uncharacterized protein n=1 Tax=Malus domestica TaxID=3750 RepID=A0A498HYW5_MALDO|nr:hypothetical protein DVH24_029893 [Malus domestica]